MTKPKRKRRWFQFSLRTLLIGVTLLAVAGGYVGWQATIVRERERLRQHVLIRVNPFDDEEFTVLRQPESDAGVNWLGRLLGDQDAPSEYVSKTISEEDLKRVEDAFPETEICQLKQR
jgi:hypothetical protein